MAISRTLSQLRTSARFAVRRQTTDVLTDAEVDGLVNEELRKLWVICGRLNRDEYHKVSGSFTIASGATTKDISTVVTDFLDLRGLDIDIGTSDWRPIRPYRFASRGYVSRLSYRIRGVTLEVAPKDLASTYPYRIHYTFSPPALALGTDAVDLPLGGDTYIIQGAAAQIRPSFEEDSRPHIALQMAAEKEVRRWLVTHGQGPPETTPEVDAAADDAYWLFQD